MNRITLAWHVLRGHSVAYRLHLIGLGLDVRHVTKFYGDQVTIIGAEMAVTVADQIEVSPAPLED